MIGARGCWVAVLLVCACGSDGAGDGDGASPGSGGAASGSGGAPSAGGTSSGSGGSAAPIGGSPSAMGGSGAGGAGASGGQPGDDGGAPGAAGQAGAAPVSTGTPTHEERAELPTVRQEHGAAALDGEVYVLGGFTPEVTTSVQAYSPDTNSWRDVAPFPVEFHHPNVAVVGGRIYVAGFHFGSTLRVADGRTYAYDPAEDAWSPRAPMPAGTERGAGCVAALESSIYVFGGAGDLTLPHASVYYTETDAWEVLPFMPNEREHCLAAAIDGRIYIVSGREGDITGLLVESYVYDPVERTYEERAPIPTPRGGAAGAELGGRIFVFGGEGNPADSVGIFGEVEAYDPSTDTWEPLPAMPIPRHGYAAAAVGDRIYLPGGATRQGFGATPHHSVFYFSAAD